MSSAATPPAPGVTTPCIMRTFGSRPFRTDGDLLAVAFAAAGDLWSIEEPGVVRRWNSSTQQQTQFQDLEDPSTLWAIHTATGRAAAGSDELQIWDLQAGKLLAGWPAPIKSPPAVTKSRGILVPSRAITPQPAFITAIAFSPDGHTIATGHDDGFVRLWEPAQDRLAGEFRAHSQPVSALAFQSDGKKIASAGEDKAIHLWDFATKKPLGSLLGHTDRISAVAWHPDGKRFLSAGWDTTARVWDLTTCEPIILLNAHAGQVLAFALSPDGTTLACADSADAIHIWDLGNYRIAGTVRGLTREVRGLAWSPDNRLLAVAGADRTIHLCDAKQPAAATITANEGARPRVAVLAEGKRLASLGAGRTLHVWEATGAQAALQLDKAGALRAFAASPNGRWIAASRVLPDEPQRWHEATRQRSEPPADMLGLWDATTGKHVRFLEGPQPPITAIAFAPDSSKLASGGFLGDDVWVWNVADGEPALLIPEAAGGGAIEGLAWHPAGKLLAVSGIDYMATGGNDGKTGIWNVEGRHTVAWVPGGGSAIAYHPRGHHLAIASLVQTVRVWDVSGKDPAPALELIGHLDAVTCLAYSPDGKLLATGGDDHSVRLWDADTGLQLGHVDLDTQVKALVFAPDGATLFTGNGNTSCYQLDVGQILAQAD